PATRALDGKPTRAPWVYGTPVASVASGAVIVWIAPDLVSLNVAAPGIHAAMLPLVAGLLVAPAAIAWPPARRARGASVGLVSAVG
ncbi:metal transporter, partial [Burkholderia pseudomallei]